MNPMKSLATSACAVAAILATGCNFPVKVTGGGKAMGAAVSYDSGLDDPTIIENVRATASGQALLTEPVYEENDQGDVIRDGYVGEGNLQFVDHATGRCFHAQMTFGGADPGLIFLPPCVPEEFSSGDYEHHRQAYGEGPVRDCASEDELYDDGTVHVWIFDQNSKGPDKGDYIIAILANADDVVTYAYCGYLESGNYKVRALSTK